MAWVGGKHPPIMPLGLQLAGLMLTDGFRGEPGEHRRVGYCGRLLSALCRPPLFAIHPCAAAGDL